MVRTRYVANLYTEGCFFGVRGGGEFGMKVSEMEDNGYGRYEGEGGKGCFIRRWMVLMDDGGVVINYLVSWC